MYNNIMYYCVNEYGYIIEICQQLMIIGIMNYDYN